MAGVNKVLLVGNLGRDPEVRYTPSGQAVASFSIATSKQWKDKDGNKQERTEWHRIVVWGRQAELCGEYLSRGRKVFLEGELQTRKFQDKQGQERYVTEINALNVQFLDAKETGDSPQRHHSAPAGSSAQATPSMGYNFGAPPDDSDVPF